MPRPLPSPLEAQRILATKRTRPPLRPPASAAHALVRTLATFNRRFGPNAESLKLRWAEIVGASLGRRSEPIRVVRSHRGDMALEVRVAGPSATLVQHQAAEMLARVNLFLGPGTVSRLRIVQGRLSAAPPRSQARAPKSRARGPLDAGLEAALATSLAGLEEGPLKRALARLGREVIRGESA